MTPRVTALRPERARPRAGRARRRAVADASRRPRSSRPGSRWGRARPGARARARPRAAAVARRSRAATAALSRRDRSAAGSRRTSSARGVAATDRGAGASRRSSAPATSTTPASPRTCARSSPRRGLRRRGDPLRLEDGAPRLRADRGGARGLEPEAERARALTRPWRRDAEARAAPRREGLLGRGDRGRARRDLALRPTGRVGARGRRDDVNGAAASGGRPVLEAPSPRPLGTDAAQYRGRTAQ